MRHAKKSQKLGRTSSHRKAMIANMLKSLVCHGRIETTVAKAKTLKSSADRLITLAKRNSLATRRRAIAELQIRFNPLTPKEARAAKEGDKSAYNTDRQVIEVLFTELRERFQSRPGGYTRIIRNPHTRVGDNAETCILEYLEN